MTSKDDSSPAPILTATDDQRRQSIRDDRREFLKNLVATGVVVGVAGASITSLVSADSVPGGPISDLFTKSRAPAKAWGFIIDLDRCDGCVDKERPDCVTACMESHYLTDMEWIVVWEMDNALGGHFFLPRPCMNCQKAPCQDVCPVGATFYNDEDIVLIDSDRCIGCRFCMAACPYQVRLFSWGKPDNSLVPDDHVYSPEKPLPLVKGTVAKCDLCYHETKEGRLPHCVLGCHTGALFYGDFNEDAVTNGDGLTVEISTVIGGRAAYQLKGELGTQPRVYYLPPR